VKLAAEQFEIAHAVKLRVVRHSRRAIAESELGAQVKLDLRAAVGGAAAERTAGAPLVHRERPFDLAPRAGRGLSRRGWLLTGCASARNGAGAQRDHFSST